jgi:hypothetical protein
MADTFVISGLRRRRAHLAGQVEAAQRALSKQRESLATLDAVIRLFEPQSNPELIAAIRPTSRRSLYFKRNEHRRLCLMALRDGARPLSCRQVAEYAMAAKGLNPEPLVRANIDKHTRRALVRLADKGIVRRIVTWPDTWWELVVDDF